MEFLKSIWRDPVWSKMIATIILGIPATLWTLRKWIFTDIYLSRAQVFGWGTLAFVTGMALAVLFVRTRRVQPVDSPAVPHPTAASPSQAKPAFKPFAVIDSKHEIEWHVVDDPAKWLDESSTDWDEEYIHGPFHSDPDCRAKLGSVYSPRSNYAATDPKCPRCQKLLFRGQPFVTVSAQGAVAEELRRMRRRGEAIAPGAILTHLDYWKGISPADKQR